MCQIWTFYRYYVAITHGSEIKYCLFPGFFLLDFGIVTRRVPLVEQKLLTFPQHPSSSLVFSGVCVTRSLVSCVLNCCLFFCPFSLGHCVACTRSSVILLLLLFPRFTDFDYPFGIFKFVVLFIFVLLIPLFA